MWTSPQAMAGQIAAQNAITVDEAVATLAKELGGGGVPAGRVGEADEVAALVLLLASPRGAYVSGADWVIDGCVLPTT